MNITILENQEISEGCKELIEYIEEYICTLIFTRKVGLTYHHHGKFVNSLNESDYLISEPTIYTPSSINLLAHDLSHISRGVDCKIKALILVGDKSEILNKLKFLGLDALASVGGILSLIPIKTFNPKDFESEDYDEDDPFGGQYYIHKKIDDWESITESDILELVKTYYSDDNNIRYCRDYFFVKATEISNEDLVEVHKIRLENMGRLLRKFIPKIDKQKRLPKQLMEDFENIKKYSKEIGLID